MKTRYDFMRQGVVQDIDRSFYPDVLSLNYNLFTATQALDPVTLDSNQIKRFWLVGQSFYGTEMLEDIPLTLNGVLHKNHLKEGDTLFFPAMDDVINSFEGD